MSQKLDSIQRMRGLAALLVVFAHSVDVVAGNGETLGTSVVIGIGYVENFGAIGVDLFFIISGFVMALSASRLSGLTDARNFMVLRWIRIAPAYLIACALMALFSIDPVTRRGVANAVGFIPVLDREVYSAPPLGIGWTLSFEFTFYLVIAVLVAVSVRRHVMVAAAALVAMGTTGILVDFDEYLLTWFTNPMYLEFALGMLCYQLWSLGLVTRYRLVGIGLGLTAVAALVAQLHYGFGDISESTGVLSGQTSAKRVLLWGVPCAAIFVALLPVQVSGRGPLGATGRVLGDASYSIYLVHLLTLRGIDEVCGRLPVADVADLVLLAAVLASAVAGVLFYLAVERPLTERLRRLYARRARTRAHLTPASTSPPG